jgi:hypothetical protein
MPIVSADREYDSEDIARTDKSPRHQCQGCVAQFQLGDDARYGQQENAAHDQARVCNTPSADGFFSFASNDRAAKRRPAKQTDKKDYTAVE